MNSCACATTAARTISSSLASGRPNAMFAAIVSLKSSVSSKTMPMFARSDCSVSVETSCPSIDTRAVDGLDEAREQAHQRRLAAAGLSDERDRRAGRDVERDAVEHGAPVRVGEVHVVVARRRRR